MSFLTGYLDFLLTPNLYDFKNTDTLIVLFVKISLYFNEHAESAGHILINQHFYTKLLYFAPYLSNYFEQYEQNNEEKNIIFENNPDENEKINLKKKKKY